MKIYNPFKSGEFLPTFLAIWCIIFFITPLLYLALEFYPLAFIAIPIAVFGRTIYYMLKGR